MKQSKQIKVEKSLHLPQIGTKTSSSFCGTNQSNSRVRPFSSSKVNELEKNLFSQLEQYDGIDKKNRKARTKKQIDPVTDKEFGNQISFNDAPYLKKLQKSNRLINLVLPETYSKLIGPKKVEPLQQAKQSRKSQDFASEISKKKPVSVSGQTQQTNKNKQLTSFQIAQKQVDAIFQQYLRQQGLLDLKQTSSQDLKELNKQISNTEAELNSIQKQMYQMIEMFGNECVDLDNNQ